MTLIFLIFAGPSLGFELEEGDLDFLDSEAEVVRTDQVVSTAAGYAQRVDRTPSNVFVIDRKMMDRVNPTHPVEMLRFVPGFVVKRRGELGWELSAMGTGASPSNKILILLDGHRVQTPGFGNAYWTSIPIETDSIERIEVVLGPESVQYGAGAFAGVVNFLSRKESKDRTRLKLTRGQNQLDQFALTHRESTDRASTILSFFGDGRRGPDGFQRISGGADPAFPDPDEVRMESLRIQHEREVSSRTKLKFSAANTETNSQNAPVSQFFGGGPNQEDTHSKFLTLDLETELDSSNLLQVRASFYDYSSQFRTPPAAPVGIPDSFLALKRTEFELRYLNDSRLGRFTLSLGRRVEDATGYMVQPGDSIDTNTAMAHLEREFGEKFVLYLGGRANWQNLSADDEVSWKVGGLYRPRRDLGFRLSMGTSFRQPDLISRRFRPVTSFMGVPLTAPLAVPNPNLDNAVARGFFQVGLERTRRDHRFKLDFYRVSFEGVMSFVGNGTPAIAPFPAPVGPVVLGQTLSFQNQAEPDKVRGISFAFEKDLSPVLQLSLSGYVQEAENRTAGIEDLLVAPRAASLLLSYSPKQSPWSGSLSLNGVDGHNHSPSLAAIGAAPRNPGYGTVDLNIEKKFTDRSRLALTVQNLLDNKHFEMLNAGIALPFADRAYSYGRQAYLTYRVDL